MSRPGLRVLPALASWVLACRAVVDPGVVYRDCDREHVRDEFEDGTTLEELLEECWNLANHDESNVLVEDGDLIVRVSRPSASRAQRWSEDGQGPMVFQRFDGDFLLASRLEVLHKIHGDLCLDEGNGVGLVARRSDPEPEWSTFLIRPYQPADPPPGLDCGEDAEVPLPIQADVHSREGRWGPDATSRGDDDATGVSFVEGEADLAMCRLGETLVFYYRDPKSTVDAPVWKDVGEAHVPGAGPLEVGVTASGAEGAFEAEGHFTWIELTDTVGHDGCKGELERLRIPAVD
jgi:hypothetical protein